MSKSRNEISHLRGLLYLVLCLLVVVHIFGTLGYDYLTDGRYSWFDCFYMTFVTISTIGFGEIIDMSGNQPGRVLTVFLAMTGTGTLSLLFSIVTVIVLESDLNGTLKRKRMEKSLAKLKGHYILCGLGRVGRNVAHEMEITGHAFVAIDENTVPLEEYKEKSPDLLYLHGDAGDDDVLRTAGFDHATGLFAVTGDDSRNLMVVLTAKQLRPEMRVVARCHEVRNIEKMKKAGADAIVSPDFTGAMRIASAMIRPHVASFMDEMLRTDGDWRIEQVVVPSNFKPTTIGEIGMRGEGFIMIAVRGPGSDWQFNPAETYILKAGDIVMVMAGADGRLILESRFSERVR